jgi:hypothetical protein
MVAVMTENKQPQKKKSLSRSARWGEACGTARTAIEELLSAIDELDTALAELRGVQEEYEEWKDNLPENLAGSALGEKLEEVCGLEIEGIAYDVRSALEEAQSTIEEAERRRLAARLWKGLGK